jgi:hypothetical protein
MRVSNHYSLNKAMTKHRLTKKQAAAKRQQAVREQAELNKLLKNRPKTNNRDISVNAIPSYQYDDPVRASSIPSAPTVPAVKRAKADYSEDEEMDLREKLAQVETDRKRKRLAPLYSKGPVQYITDDTDPTELGRKI